MTDPNQWQAPGGPSTPPPPAYGAPPQPAFGGGWTPPPKPGLIPLRPLGVGTILGASFQVLRRNPRPTFGISLLLNTASTLLFGIVIGAFVAYGVARVASATSGEQDQIVSGTLLAGGLTLLIPLAASFAVTAIMQGIIALEVARGTVAEKLRARGLFRLARGRIGVLIGWGLLVVAFWLVLIAIAATVVTVIIASGGTVALVVGILLGVGAVIVLVVGYLWISTKVSLVPSVLMLERLTLGAAIARSWRLTSRHFWRTLGIELLQRVIVSAATQVISLPISILASVVSAVVAPTGDEGTMLAVFGIAELVAGIVSIFTSSVTTVMLSATSALIYIDLRMRKEGLDLDLQHFVEARQAGDSSIADPYRTVPVPAPAFTQPAPGSGSPWV